MNIVKKQLDIINDPFIKKIVSGDETIKKQFQIFLLIQLTEIVSISALRRNFWNEKYIKTSLSIV